MSFPRFNGLVAAAFTPFHADRSIDPGRIPRMVEHTLAMELAGLYVLGSTGEGGLLTSDERRSVAEAYVEAAAGRLPILIQVGHESIEEARSLASHAASIGADGISAVPPVYFKAGNVEQLVDCLAHVAGGAPDSPFYYYHVPALTGIEVDMLEFLELGGARIPNLRGVKFTTPELDVFQAASEFEDGRFEILMGRDEMLLPSLASGARGAVGSTYTYAPGPYLKVIEAFGRGQLEEARAWQAKAQALVRVLIKHGPRWAQKAILGMVGLDCGPCRPPIRGEQAGDLDRLCEDLNAIGYFGWCGVPGAHAE